MLTVMLFVLMIMIGGMAVDLMRYERQRTELQHTTDAAVLAAASMRQTRPALDVVDDYFAAAGLEEFLVDKGTNPPSLNSKIVWADAMAEVDTFFMHMMDIDTLAAPAAATAEESVGNIEISLVLDISGSMRFGDQIGKLRTAAKGFFATVLEGPAANTTSINVVPYAGSVNVGPTLFTRFGATRMLEAAGAPAALNPGQPLNMASTCIELLGTDYTNMNPPPAGRGQLSNFMQWVIDTGTMNWGWCPTDNSAMRLAQNNKAQLDAFIDGIRLHDGTGTHTGVKYGLMLLNPAFQPHFQALAGGAVPAAFADRPRPFNDPNTKKYLIVMTDGAITDQFRPRFSTWRDVDTDSLDNEQVNGVNDPDTVDGTDHVLWNRTVELERQPSGNRTGALTSASANVTSFNSQCNMAKANGITVYTIAFNAGATAETQMRNCSSGGAYYYAVTGNEIISAFRAIARDIRQLQLTQ
jgi:Flp pilus assembly protein TadG